MKKTCCTISYTKDLRRLCDAYELDGYYGFRFVVVKQCHRIVFHGKEAALRRTAPEWCVAQFETGIKCGPLCDRRRDAIEGFKNRIKHLENRLGKTDVGLKITEQIAAYPNVNK